MRNNGISKKFITETETKEDENKLRKLIKTKNMEKIAKTSMIFDAVVARGLRKTYEKAIISSLQLCNGICSMRRPAVE